MADFPTFQTGIWDTITNKLENIKISTTEIDTDSNSNEQEKSINTKTTNAGNDEGYISSFPSPRPQPSQLSPPTPITITHRISTTPKTQHYAKHIILFATSSNDEDAGQISARYIDRSLLPRSKSHMSFYIAVEELNEGSSDGLAFATQLFCPKGTLMSKHRSDKWKDVGPWGSELESGGILILGLVIVEKDFRRQGLGARLLEALVERAQERVKRGKGRVKFVVVMPAVVKEDFEEEVKDLSEEERNKVEERHYANAVGFYRAQGFRRIGLSKWFALALDPEHRSRKIAVEDDLNPPDVR